MLKQMEPPQENQAGPGQQPPPSPPLTPGTIINPQKGTAPAVPAVPAVPANEAMPPTAEPVGAAAPAVPQPTIPKPANPAPVVPPQPTPIVVPAAQPAVPKPAALNSPVPVEPVIEKVPVVPPPVASAMPALKPVEEKLITRPGIELRPMEVKPISAPGSLKNQISTAAHPESEKTIPAAQPLSPPPRQVRIYEKVPYRLSLTVTVAVAVAIFSLLQPVKTPTIDTSRINMAAAVISLALCIGLLVRSNLARSLFVTVNIAAIIIQIFVIYQIRNEYATHPAQVSAYTKSIPGYTHKVVDWIDPTYHQGNQRLLVLGGELFTVFALTTLSMGKVFEKRP